MGGVKKLITGESPKPKEDKEAKKLQQEQIRLERQRQESADRALESSRRARLAGGGGRTGLAYQPPGTGGGTLG